VSVAGPLQNAKAPVGVIWPAEAIWEAVVPLLPGFTVEILPEIDSTNSELMRRARAGQRDATLLVAERQTAGRGRLGRDWHSDTQGLGTTLTFSLGLPLNPLDWSGLSLAVGLSVAQSLHPKVQIKWPNDLWLFDRKLAGILIETATWEGDRYAVIGIGINIVAGSATGLRTAPAGLHELLAGVQAPDVLAQVVPPLVREVVQFSGAGFAPLAPAFSTRDVLLGREVVCTDGTTGWARGVDATGALMVQTAAGMQAISSAEVSVRPTGTGATTLNTPCA
jgi:BirA family transcriptional regulator, biotin operon repressor / biotin---[acetyl-CoA-carboxylase] ligase